MNITKTLLPVLCFLLVSGHVFATPPPPVCAQYLIVTADDFVVDAYLNGKLIKPESRQMLAEVYGATVERMNVTVHKGDWIVFNVVNDRLRWNGSYYFAVAGCLDTNQFGLVSDRSDAWCVWNSADHADRFISRKGYGRDHRAEPVQHPWDQGDARMRQYAGAAWAGMSLWGSPETRNVWIKVIVP